ncbi:TetR/AcrR family transcriptional regulator [Micromonospora coerulea]|uniref:TetR/AcrR family transcriptional regulator n=1 Tax=Micromonospora coerulea TaxID=47856 RepID=A0ABP8S8F8_9ACTN
MPQIGRPRAFDAEAALDRAVEVFWRQGYEGASLTDLTNAMGINKPSLYAAYGNKEGLFRKVVARYADVEMAYARDALTQPTAYEVAAAMLRANVVALTRPDRPAGCLSIQGGTACSTENAGIAAFLAASRLAGEQALAERFARAVEEHDLPEGADPVALARFVSIVTEGQAVHAAAGVTRAQLEQAAEIALHAFAAAAYPDRPVSSAGR